MTIADETLSKLNAIGLNMCPRCRASAGWAVDLLSLEGHKLVPSEAGQPSAMLPMAVVICKRCGFTAMHNLIVLGIDLTPRAEESP